MSQSSVEGAEGWVKAKAAFSDMWEGISRAVAEPILEYLTNHWQDVRAAMISFTDATIEAIPVAMGVIVDYGHRVLTVLEIMLKNTAGIAEIFGYLGNSAFQNMAPHLASLANDLDRLNVSLDEVTQSSEKFRAQWRARSIEMDGGFDVGQGGPRTVHNHISIDARDTSPQQAGDAVRRELESRARRQRGAATSGHVAHATGAKRPISLFDIRDYQ